MVAHRGTSNTAASGIVTRYYVDVSHLDDGTVLILHETVPSDDDPGVYVVDPAAVAALAECVGPIAIEYGEPPEEREPLDEPDRPRASLESTRGRGATGPCGAVPVRNSQANQRPPPAAWRPAGRLLPR
jgi:hypothetical protein